MQSRRQALKKTAVVAGLLASTGLFPHLVFASVAASKAGFEAKSIQDALKALGAGALVASKDVTLTAPDIAENGTVVPLAVSTTLPGVKRLLIMVEKNPFPLVAVFNVSDSLDPAFTTRAKMGQSSDVYAVAIMGDGRALFVKKEVKVTLGGCGG